MAAEMRKWYRASITMDGSSRYVIPMSKTEKAILDDVRSRIEIIEEEPYSGCLWIGNKGYETKKEALGCEYYDWTIELEDD